MSSGQETNFFNPYAPVLEAAAPDIHTDVEATRHLYLNHEASVKTVGLLFVLGGSLLCIIAIFLIFAIAIFGLAGASPLEALIVMCPFGLLGPLQLITGLAVRKFKPWSRVVGSVFSAIGLLFFPIGTLINGYFLYLFLSRKGAMVFSPEYAAIIAATPHLKYKTSKWVTGILLAFVALFVLVISFALLGAPRLSTSVSTSSN